VENDKFRSSLLYKVYVTLITISFFIALSIPVSKIFEPYFSRINKYVLYLTPLVILVVLLIVKKKLKKEVLLVFFRLLIYIDILFIISIFFSFVL